MTKTLSLEELRERLRSAKNETESHLFFAALLREAAEIPTDEFFVVGGSAIEIHTLGRYTSGDIDIVTADVQRFPAILKGWGFKKDSRVWVNDELRVVVDLVKYPYTGSVERTTLVATPFGPVRLASIEDLFVKRLISTKFWRERGDIEQAKMLAVTFRDRMDWDYIESFAKREDVLDLSTQIRGALEASAGAKGRRNSKAA